MRPHHYELIVAWSEDDDAFIVEVPELPGCMAHRSTPSAAVANAQQAISLCLESARAAGREIPQAKGRRSA